MKNRKRGIISMICVFFYCPTTPLSMAETQTTRKYEIIKKRRLGNERCGLSMSTYSAGVLSISDENGLISLMCVYNV